MTPPSPRAFKVLLAAEHLGLAYEVAYVDIGRGAHRTDRFRQMNVNQKMPVLEADGFLLWESNAIVEYMATVAGVLAGDAQGRASIVKWLYWDMAPWDWVWCDLIFERLAKPVLGLGPADAAIVARCAAGFDWAAGVLQARLDGRGFVEGDGPTIADLVLAAPLCHAEWVELPVGAHPAIAAWLGRMRALPGWDAAMRTMRRPERSEGAGAA